MSGTLRARAIKAALVTAASAAVVLAVACAATAPGAGGTAGCSVIGRYVADGAPCGQGVTVTFTGTAAACGYDGGFSVSACENLCGSGATGCTLVDAGVIACQSVCSGDR